jgi:hypothetical protein
MGRQLTQRLSTMRASFAGWLVLLSRANAFQFVIGGDETSTAEECFMVEMPQDTAFVARYKFPGAGFGSGSGALVTLTDTKDSKEMFKARVEEQQGTLTMTTFSDAMHKLCVKPEVRQTAAFQ